MRPVSYVELDGCHNCVFYEKRNSTCQIEPIKEFDIFDESLSGEIWAERFKENCKDIEQSRVSVYGCCRKWKKRQ